MLPASVKGKKEKSNISRKYRRQFAALTIETPVTVRPLPLAAGPWLNANETVHDD